YRPPAGRAGGRRAAAAARGGGIGRADAAAARAVRAHRRLRRGLPPARRGPRLVPPRARSRGDGRGRQRRARGPPARGVQPLPAGLLRVAQASRDVALLPQVRGAAAEHRRPRGRAAGDLAALGLAAAVRPAREPPGRRFVHTPPRLSRVRLQPRALAPYPAPAGEGRGGVPSGSARTWAPPPGLHAPSQGEWPRQELAAETACMLLPVGVEGPKPHLASAWYRPWETSSRPSPWRLSGIHRLGASRPTIFASQRNGEPRQADLP